MYLNFVGVNATMRVVEEKMCLVHDIGDVKNAPKYFKERFYEEEQEVT